MINFASLFGSFNRGGNSPINDLIDKPDTQLDQLLDIESFPNQYKSGNTKILQFMKYHKYKEMLKYVTVEGPADNQKKGYKFPMVAAEILSVQNMHAIEYFLPDNEIEIDVQYESTEEVEFEVDDDEEQQTQAQTVQTQEKQPEMTPEDASPQKTTQQASEGESETKTTTQIKQETQEAAPQPKKKKIVKQKRPVKRTKKQPREPLMPELLKYYEGPVNYTLAGYNCKVLTMLYTKKSSQFFKFIFNSPLNYVELLCNHIESKSVGDLIVKMLSWETTEFIEERKTLYDHLIQLMSEFKESHVLSNLSAAIYEVIEKTATYIKSKPNIANNQEMIQTFLNIFYRTSQVHKIVNNAMSQQENISAYNCAILQAYLHFTEVETFNSFKLEEVLQTFITKASEKLREIPKCKVLGMGRVKIVEIFSYLIRKQPKTVEDENKTNEMSPQLLEQLYVHSMIANVPDFFSILIKLVQSFENNNILHNQIYKIFQSVLKEPQSNRSALQQLLLNDQNVLLKFIVFEAQNDSNAKNTQKYTPRRGFIAHVINLCRLIEDLSTNTLINQRLIKAAGFQDVMSTLVANDTIETSKSLAGYQMKKNPTRDVMFQKQEILNNYAQFLSQCPKPIFEPYQPTQINYQEDVKQDGHKQTKDGEKNADRQLMQEQNDEEKFNEVIATSKVNPTGQSDPKFWITHMQYDLDQLIQDVL